jgi:uncharacterized HhH-GPD family protein
MLDGAATKIRGTGDHVVVEQADRPADGTSRADGKAAEVVALLLAFGRHRAQTPVRLAPTEEANRFLEQEPFAFLVAVIFDQGIVAERAWAAPLELRRRIGHWDVARIAREPNVIAAAVAARPALHRMVEKVPRWIVLAAQRVLDEYGGDAAAIWSNRPSAAELQRRLDAFEGIGQKKAAMAVEILEYALGVPLHRLDGSDIAYDVHVRRVFLRSGIARRDDPMHMIAAARSLHPERPGALDAPAWHVGREWCRPTSPDCTGCPLVAACPQLTERASGVRGM